MKIFAVAQLRRSLPVALAVAALALVGCGSRFKTYCEKRAECSGGNDKDQNACIAEAEGQRDVASAYDCSDPFDKVADCYESTGHCSGGKYTTSCDAEEAALGACEKAASAKK
jgi:hypothetical protein